MTSQTVTKPAGLLLDLDGTVLPENNQPTPRVMKAVAEAAQRIPVAVASGREQDEVGHFARLFGLISPQVAENGATLMDPVTGRSLKRNVMSRESAEMLVGELAKVSSKVLVSDGGRFVREPSEIVDWQVSIIMARLDDGDAAREWARRYPEDVISGYATTDNQGDWYIDFTAPGVNKSTGVRDFCDAVGIDPSSLMVIGDGSNDVPMFEAAGIAIAMGSSGERLIELATDTTLDLENDGAALAIEKYILNR